MKKFLDFTGLSTFKQNILNVFLKHTSDNNIHMSSDEKAKLSGIAENANNYTLPLASSSRGGVKIGYTQNGRNYPVQLDAEKAYVNVPWTDTNTTYSNFVKSGPGAKAGLVPAPSTTAGLTKYLREDGAWVVPPDNNTTYSNMTGSTASAAGKAGLTPAPAAGAATRYLRCDGTWQVPPDTNTTYSAATTSANGLMTAAMVTKLNGIATGANAYTHPTTAGNKHIPSGGSSGQILRWSAAGTAVWGSENNVICQASEPTTQAVGELWFKEE